VTSQGSLVAAKRYCSTGVPELRRRSHARPVTTGVPYFFVLTKQRCVFAYYGLMSLSARMPDLAALEVLLAIARTGSLGAAGREIGLTQQAVSARVTSMEAQTGIRLVIRTKRGSKLTPAGVVAVQWSDRLLEVAHQVDAGFATLRADSRNRVRVSASLTIAEQLLPRWLVTMQAAAAQRGTTAPEVVLTATNSDHVLAAVRDNDADLGFVESPGIPRGVRCRVVAHDELVVIVPAGHKWARRSAPITAAELNHTARHSRTRLGYKGFSLDGTKRGTRCGGGSGPTGPRAVDSGGGSRRRAGGGGPGSDEQTRRRGRLRPGPATRGSRGRSGSAPRIARCLGGGADATRRRDTGSAQPHRDSEQTRPHRRARSLRTPI